MKLIYCLMIFLWPVVSTAQKVTALTIGDKVPDVEINHIVNYPASSLSLSQFKNKLIILDFMSTGCAPCIEELPAFDSLQKKFRNNLQILLVISESVSRVHSFLKRKNIAGIHLAIVAEDTTLSQLFPHTYLPHDVWLKDGKVLSITRPEYVVAKNIQLIIENKVIDMPVKRDLPSFDYNQPLLHWNDDILTSFSVPKNSYYSTLTSHMPDVPERFIVQKDSGKNILRMAMINVPIIDLYMRALYGVGLKPAFIILNVPDTSKYQYNANQGYYQKWLLKNTFCYEALFPLNTNKEEIKNRIKNDLDFYLGLQGRMIKKNVPCWVISKTSNASVIKKNKSVSNLDPLKNASINDILFYLNKDFGNTPAIDETGFGELKLQGLLRSQCTDIGIVKRKLNEYGLDISKSLRTIDMMVISEKKSK